MAKMITRTFITTKVTALVVNLDTKQTENVEVTLPQTYKDDKALAKALAKAIDSEAQKFVSALSTENVEVRLGMTEEDFVKNAVKMPPLKKGETDTAEVNG